MTGADGFQNKNFNRAIRCLSPNYHDSSGFTFRDAQQFLLQWCKTKDNQVWLQVSVIKVVFKEAKHATATVEAKGILEIEESIPANFGPVIITVELERTWWGRWRIIAIEGWQADATLTSLQSMMEGE